MQCSSSSSIVCIDANGIDSLIAMSIESLLKYPCGDSLMLLAKISSLRSAFGSRPVHNRNSGLLGNGALIVPFRLSWQVVLGSATTRALPKNFGAVFNSEDCSRSVYNRV
jgi:hypothetical protein